MSVSFQTSVTFYFTDTVCLLYDATVDRSRSQLSSQFEPDLLLFIFFVCISSSRFCFNPLFILFIFRFRIPLSFSKRCQIHFLTQITRRSGKKPNNKLFSSEMKINHINLNILALAIRFIHNTPTTGVKMNFCK